MDDTSSQNKPASAAASPKTGSGKGFGVYVHWPYCLSKCPYCDFFSQVKKNVNQDELISGYLQDLNFYRSFTEGRTVTSIFFGGGTPSLLKPQNIEKIINAVAKNWQLSPYAEISLEANPNTNNGTLFSDLRQAGINRLSLGVQALDDRSLCFLGRTHNLAQALNAVDEVLRTFDNHSMDLIYARPEQSPEEWLAELNQAASFGFKHLSFYQLTIEEGTVFAKKGIRPADEETAAALYNLTNDTLPAFGYNRYEISNYAREGFQSAHNKLYWQGNDYLGIGPAAHGRIKNRDKIFATTHHLQMESLTPAERAEELIIMGLRLTEGIDKAGFAENCGIPFDAFVNHTRLEKLSAQELITDTPQNIYATEKGFLVLNRIIEELCS